MARTSRRRIRRTHPQNRAGLTRKRPSPNYPRRTDRGQSTGRNSATCSRHLSARRQRDSGPRVSTSPGDPPFCHRRRPDQDRCHPPADTEARNPNAPCRSSFSCSQSTNYRQTGFRAPQHRGVLLVQLESPQRMHRGGDGPAPMPFCCTLVP